MRVLSLCSGYGGLEMGVEMAGEPIELVTHAEFDPHAAAIHEAHWPGVPNLGDIKAIDWAGLEPVDLITAGYPCQPFSHAGQRKGTDDPRHLWPHIAEAVRVLRPRRILLENVAGHLTLGFGAVLGDLAEAGYDARWTCVRASDIGAPHKRERVFIVASDTSHRADDGQRTRPQPRQGGASTTDASGAGAGRDDRAVPGEVQGRSSIDVRPAGDDRGPAADPAHVGHERRGCTRRGWDGSADSGDAPADSDGEGARGPAQEQAGPLERRGAADDDLAPAWGPYGPAVRRWEHLTRPAPRPTDDSGRLSAPFVEWMMGLPAGWVTALDLPRTAQLKALGNGVVPQCAALAWSQLTAPELLST